ncbi:hypothetical protein [Burkholderia alba]|uniref:hypothetical protein n=1 Tax=Burkholderia alba TaxID=2683677 RepID=UPI002B0571CA|nr:hypothetical protein [Burkholderia alba]
MRPDLETKVEEAIDEAAIRLQDEAREILRALRQAVNSPSLFQWGGGVRHVHEAQILLAYLLEHTRETRGKQDAADGTGPRSRAERDVRMLWRQTQVGDPSRQRKLAGQQHREFANTLRLLSSAVARFASEAGYPGIYEDAPASFPLGEFGTYGSSQDSLGEVRPKNRVGRLRAYGNAINDEAATQFILAAQDILIY